MLRKTRLFPSRIIAPCQHQLKLGSKLHPNLTSPKRKLPGFVDWLDPRRWLARVRILRHIHHHRLVKIIACHAQQQHRTHAKTSPRVIFTLLLLLLLVGGWMDPRVRWFFTFTCVAFRLELGCCVFGGCGVGMKFERGLAGRLEEKVTWVLLTRWQGCLWKLKVGWFDLREICWEIDSLIYFL